MAKNDNDSKAKVFFFDCGHESSKATEGRLLCPRCQDERDRAHRAATIDFHDRYLERRGIRLPDLVGTASEVEEAQRVRMYTTLPTSIDQATSWWGTDSAEALVWEAVAVLDQASTWLVLAPILAPLRVRLLWSWRQAQWLLEKRGTPVWHMDAGAHHLWVAGVPWCGESVAWWIPHGQVEPSGQGFSECRASIEAVLSSVRRWARGDELVRERLARDREVRESPTVTRAGRVDGRASDVQIGTAAGVYVDTLFPWSEPRQKWGKLEEMWPPGRE